MTLGEAFKVGRKVFGGLLTGDWSWPLGR